MPGEMKFLSPFSLPGKSQREDRKEISVLSTLAGTIIIQGSNLIFQSPWQIPSELVESASQRSWAQRVPSFRDSVQQSNNNQTTIKQQPNPTGSLLQFCKFTSAPKPSRRTCWSSTFIAFIPNFSPLWLGTAQIGRCRWERLRAAGVAQTHRPQFSLWNAEIFPKMLQSCGRIWKALLFYGPSCNGTEMSFPLRTPNAGMAFCSWADNFPGWNKKKNSDISTPIFALYFLM